MVSISAVVCLATLAFCTIPDAYASCHSGWMPYTGAYCVRKFDLRKNWFEARASCRSHGAELVTVASWNQNIYMRGYLRDSGKHYWTAGSYLHGYWRWDGLVTSGFGYTDWAPGEPNNYKGAQEDCLLLLHDRGGRWNDESCYSRFEYICQKRART